MYVFIPNKVVRRKVTILVPKDGADFDKQECFVTWKLDDSKSVRSMDEKFFNEVITNIEGVATLVDDGAGNNVPKEIPYTPEFRAAFVGTSYHLAALQREYINCTVAAGRGN
jgi:lipocalin